MANYIYTNSNGLNHSYSQASREKRRTIEFWKRNKKLLSKKKK